MSLKRITSPEDIHAATSLSQDACDQSWQALLESVRRNGRGVSLAVHTQGDGSIGRVVAGHIETIDKSGDVARSGVMPSPCLVKPDGGSYTFEELGESITFDFDDSSFRYLELSPNLNLDTLGRTRLHVHIPSSEYTETKSVSGLDNLPPHLNGRVVTEPYPYVTRSIVYLDEGDVVYERLDESIQDSLMTTPDTITINGAEYIPSTVEAVFDDGIRTSHYTLRGDDLTEALGSGVIAPRLASNQSINYDAIHDRIPCHEFPADGFAIEPDLEDERESIDIDEDEGDDWGDSTFAPESDGVSEATGEQDEQGGDEEDSSDSPFSVITESAETDGGEPESTGTDGREDETGQVDLESDDDSDDTGDDTDTTVW